MHVSNITCFLTASFLATWPQSTRQSRIKTCYIAQADPELVSAGIMAWDTPPPRLLMRPHPVRFRLYVAESVHKWVRILIRRANAHQQGHGVHPSPVSTNLGTAQLLLSFLAANSLWADTLRAREHPVQAHLVKDKHEWTQTLTISTGGLCTGSYESVESNYNPETNNQIQILKRDGWQTGS